MKSFKDYTVLLEGSTEAAKEMEYVLVDAVGGKSGKRSYPNLRPFALKRYPEKKNASILLAKEILRNAGINKRGGRMSKSATVSAEWLGNNKTPKTDIILADMKVSLKKGSSQIMSGGSAESLSTFNVAAKKAIKGDLPKIAAQVQAGIEKLLPAYKSTEKGGADIQKFGGTVYKNTAKGKSLEKKLANAKSAKYKADIQKQLDDITLSKTVKKKSDKGYGQLDKDQVLREANVLNSKLTKQFTQLFENLDFKKEFVFEAMTGKVKFGGNEGTADHFLVVDFDGSGKLNKVTSSQDSYVSKILSQVKPKVRFKTTAVKKVIDGVKSKTGHYDFRSTVGLLYTAADNTKNEINNMMNSGELEYLSEGFFDFVSKAWKKFKSFVSNLIEKVTNFITQSVNNMMEYFDLKPSIIFKNNVKW